MIIGEFAINPSAIDVHDRDLNFLLTCFGFANGAVIAEFPSSWIGFLLKKAHVEINEESDLKRVILKLHKLKEQCLIEARRDYDNSKTWTFNALQQHNELPFYMIVDEERCRGNPDVVTFDELDDSVFENLRGGKYPRDASTQAETSRLLLLNSCNIKIIDPFFKPVDGYIKTIRELIRVSRYALRTDIVGFEVHASVHQGGQKIDVEETVQIIEGCFPKIIPYGKAVTFFWWDDVDTREIHPRYLISEIAGLRYDRGFQEPADLGHREGLADISVMSRRECDDAYFRYVEERSPYKLVERCKITGSR